ncbi:hypothetical protein A9505_03895 [Methanobrevibacter sp. A27]|nr:hypothetical protein A9505_03895 [Methanobrevibacter sp. A27]
MIQKLINGIINTEVVYEKIAVEITNQIGCSLYVNFLEKRDNRCLTDALNTSCFEENYVFWQIFNFPTTC